MDKKENFMSDNALLYRAAIKYYDNRLKKYDIGYGQVVNLMMIHEHPGITMKELSSSGSVDKGTITKSVSKLHDAGYIRIEENNLDKRSKILKTTPKSKDVITEMYLARKDWWSHLTSDLTLEEVDQLEKTMHLLVKKAIEEPTYQNHFRIFGFQKLTLLDYPGKLAEIEVIPYGFPPINKNRKYIPFAGRKIKVLFVGGLSQRKGISYFFDAIKGLENDLEVTVVGSGNINNCKVLKKALSNVNYIPSLPHEQILALMAAHDLFIFPSLFEGFGLVITEAMSQGTPVITTERTCGPEIIKHGENGWIVEAGTSEPISILLQQFIDCPEILEIAGRKAMKVANSRPWDCYGKELAESVKKYLNE